MFRLSYSNRLEPLIAALDTDLAAERATQGDPLATASILIPNQLVASHLKLEIARRNGIAAGLQLPFLDSFLAKLAPAHGNTRVLPRAGLQALLDGMLESSELLATDDLEPVRNYLQAAGSDPDATALRRFQLADRLAGLFTDYSVTRPGLAAAWPRGPALAENSTTERWQRRLWMSLFGRGGKLDRIRERDGVDWVLLPRLFTHTPIADLQLPPTIYVFGFSYLARAYLDIFRRCAKKCDVRLYVINPCREFWEDIGDDLDDNLPLQLWGKPGRDAVRGLGELSGQDFADSFVEPEASSLLGRVQRDVLSRMPAAPGESDDGSLRVLACPDRQRELEIIGNEIWRAMRADSTLRFNDIAVYLTRADQEQYQALVPSVFGELHRIPHHLARVPLGGPMVEALGLLLELPFGSFSRPELLRLLTHPAIIGRYHDVDANDWIHWSERLGIVHGADHRDHANTYIERDVFNWDQGIRRLALGAFMAGSRSGVDRAIDFGGTKYVPEELDQEALPTAARFALLTRSLIEDARFCREATMPLTRWRVFLDLLATSYLIPTDEEQERELSRCRRAIAGLADADIDGRDVGYRTACELVRAQLGSSRQSSGEQLAAGVMVAPLSPMLPIPFRMVFVAGLGAGKFPAAVRESPLDLRTHQPRVGDVSNRDRDRYAFLETLLSARQALYLSYVSADSQTGEQREPSSAVQELRQLVSGYTSDDIGREHPRRSWDAAYFPQLFGADHGRIAGSVSPGADRRARAAALRADLERHLRQRNVGPASSDTLRQVLADPSWSAVRQRLRMPRIEVGGHTTPERQGALSLSLSMVRRFLESPLQTWASVVLRLRDDELEDLVAREDESFGSTPLVTTMLLRGVFAAHLASGEDEHALQTRYSERAVLAELSGQAPTGVFSTLERERHRRVLEAWLGHLGQLSGPEQAWSTVGFGRSRPDAPTDRLVSPIIVPIELAGAEVNVEIHGTTDPIDTGGLGSLVLVASSRVRRSHVLRGFVDHLALSASGVADGRPHTSTIITAGDKRERYRFAPWSQPDAHEYLRSLVSELLGGPHEYLLPCEAVFKHRDKPERPIAGIIDELLLKPRLPMSSRYGPVSQLDGLRAPAHAEAMAERRFGALYERLEKLVD